MGAADRIVVGVRNICVHGRLADPALQKVLLIGDAPAAEVNFRLLREMRELRRQEERQRRAEQLRLEEEERNRREDEKQAEQRRQESQQQAARMGEAMAVMPAPVTAEDAMIQAAMKMGQQREKAAAEKPKESPEEAAMREKNEKALAWLLEY